MLTSSLRHKLSCLLLFVAFAVAAVSAADPSTQPATAQLQAAPLGAASPGGDDGDSISSPAGGSDAASILANEAHMMGGSQDSTDGDKDDPEDDAKSPSGQKRGGHDGHKGQCVTACATKSTEGVGCGNDLSKPDCFCKSENFIDQTFACINATCPQQFHGAAGVIKSICAVAGAPNLNIPGYNSSSNLEDMPTINNDDGTNNTTTTTPPTGSTDDGSKNTTTPATGSSNDGGVTSTFVMPASGPTPNAGAKNSSQTGPTGQTSDAVHQGVAGVAMAVTAALTVASFGVWTLF